MDPECRTAVENAAKLYGELGHNVEEAAPVVPEDYFSWFLITFLAAVSQGFAFAEEMRSGRWSRFLRLKRDPCWHLQLALLSIKVNEASVPWDDEPVPDRRQL